MNYKVYWIEFTSKFYVCINENDKSDLTTFRNIKLMLDEMWVDK